LKGERGWKGKKLKEMEKTNNQVERKKIKQRNKQKNFQRYKQGEAVY
jgi:mRNA-degrading endonuclease RelE of RelBE toxin-antitoxin system